MIFSFRQNNSIRIIECQLHISNYLQKFDNNTDILPALSTNHFPLFILVLKDKSDKNGNGFWKFNNSLVYDAVYAENKKKIITKINNFNKFTENAQIKEEFLKCEILESTIDNSKTIAKKLVVKKNEITDSREISNNIKTCYDTLFLNKTNFLIL